MARKSPTVKELINLLRETLAEALMTPIIYLAPKDTEGGQRLIRWVGDYTKEAKARIAREKVQDHDFFCECEACTTFMPAE
jgi:hypothetical protein